MPDTLSPWLQLREPADWAARSQRLTQAIVDAVGQVDTMRAVDLGTGTGSNLRYLAEHLPRQQHWLAVDQNPALLAELPQRTASWGLAHGYAARTDAAGCRLTGEQLDCLVETRRVDLDTLGDPFLFDGRHLVTASALLDLVSEQWLRTLAQRARDSGAAVLFTITYNGRSSCAPVEPEDDLVRTLLNRHQGRDKGLGGLAAGPDAAACADACLTEVGYIVQRAPSNWTLGPEDRELQRQLVEGWAQAAIETESDLASAIVSWRTRRFEHIDEGRSHVLVGHDDLAAWLED